MEARWMNPDTLVKVYLTAGLVGTVFLAAALLIEFFSFSTKDGKDHPLTWIMSITGIILILAALITNFIFIISR